MRPWAERAAHVLPVQQIQSVVAHIKIKQSNSEGGSYDEEGT